jgi:membrane protease YdiL (CAAX protease family)
MNIFIFALIPYLAMILGLHVFHNAWIAFALYHGLILLSMLSVRDRGSWKELRQGWHGKIGGGAVVFGLTGGVVLTVLAPWAGIDKTMIAPILSRLGLHGIWWPLFVFYHALVNPWFEEVFWRGKLGSKNKWPVLNDFLFAGYHLLVLVLFLDWMWMLLAFGILTLAGWLWRQLKRHCGGLLLPVVSHAAADASIMAAVYWINR